MTRLSVNINKIATLRNARGGGIPNVIETAKNIESYGAQGITVHPRPDERHITKKDVYALAEVVKTEFNIEGYPNERYLNMIGETKPAQATLVPDPPDALTSNAGWDTEKHFDFLKNITESLHALDIRVSLFMENDNNLIQKASEIGIDRVELYTGPYASDFASDREKSIAPYIASAEYCHKLGLGVNAGHDLNLKNLNYFFNKISHLKEVSIGHSLVSDALYYGLENTVLMYLQQLNQ